MPGELSRQSARRWWSLHVDLKGNGALGPAYFGVELVLDDLPGCDA